MLRLFFIILLTVHGFIHLIGFVKAFDVAKINAITQEITKQVGVLWLLAMITLIVTSICYLQHYSNWWVLALLGVAVSQVLILLYWQDAKFGTIANMIILITASFAFAEWRFEKQYKQEVRENMKLPYNNSLVTHESMAHLPEPVKRYLIYSGAIDQPFPKNFTIRFEGQIRQDEKSDWMPFTSEQYNFIERPTRLFFMKAKMKGLPVNGYHSFKDGSASMDIRLFSFITVQYQDGPEMNQSETVTWFNDVCLFAPGALIDERITWETIDDLTAKATFSNKGITISAILNFNERGELTNFISDDRYRIISKSDTQLLRFSTPMKNYSLINGYRVPAYGETVWRLPGGDLTYGQFNCEYIQYNVTN